MSRDNTAVRDAVRCHFEDGERPKAIRLHLVHDEVVPAQALIDYLEGGHPLDEFLDDFPVSRAQTIAALEVAKEALVDRAPAA